MQVICSSWVAKRKRVVLSLLESRVTALQSKKPASQKMWRSSDALWLAMAGVLGVSFWILKRKKHEHLTSEIARLVRSNIRSLAPYRCARDDYSTGVLLDANENAFGPALSSDPLSKEARLVSIHRYPDPLASQVREGVGKLRGVPAENVFVGVGSDEAIDLLFRVFCEPKASSVLIMPPTYGMYKVCAAANDVRVLSAPLDRDFDIDVTRCVKMARAHTRLVFVTSPGNPTSRSVSGDRVLELVRRLPRSIIVVDEAYVDCCVAKTLSPKVLSHPRLVVLHTLSKAFGLAGARVGTAIASAETVHFMNNLKAPYNVNALTAKLAASALSDSGIQAMRQNVNQIVEQRERLVDALRTKTYIDTVYPSDANFLLCKLRPTQLAKPLYKALADEAKIVVRYRGDQLNCEGCIRITIGTPSENDALLRAIDDIAPKAAAILPPNGVIS